MEELIKRLTIEYNETQKKANQLLEQIYDCKIRECLEKAAARRNERIKALEDEYNAKIMNLRELQQKRLKQEAEKAEENRLKKIMAANADIEKIIADEEAAWKVEQEAAQADAAEMADNTAAEIDGAIEGETETAN